MDGAGKGFLAAAGLANDQDRQAIARRLGGDGQRGAKFRRCTDQLIERQVGSDFFGQGRQLAGSAAAIGMRRQRIHQSFGGDRLGEIIGRAGTHRIDRQGHRSADRRAR